MELANHLAGPQGVSSGVRTATQADAKAVTRLLQTAVYSHLHVDWNLPADWLGSPGFVVIPKPEKEVRSPLSARLFPDHDSLLACLAATADPLPAAWVRVAAIAQHEEAKALLAEMIKQVLPQLRQQGVAQLAWLMVDAWPEAWLPDFGFFRGSAIETYLKSDRSLPLWSEVAELAIRPAQAQDLERLAILEQATFDPIWRYSASALQLAGRQSLSFDVACLEDEIVGYQLSARSEFGAHLVRLTVDPEHQGLGIGSALLGHTLTNFHRRGLDQITLNTQAENTASHRLYKKFGFVPNNNQFPIWILDIE